MYTVNVDDVQEVATYMSHVEVFVTGIKVESSDQSPFESQSRDQGNLRTVKIKESRTSGCNLTFDL